MTSRAQRGWTLVELLVAVTLSLLVIAGLGEVYLGAKRSYELQTSLARIQDTGRYAIETLTQDIRRAGYWGLMSKPNVLQFSLTPPPLPASPYFPTGNVTPNGTCPTSNSDWGRMVTEKIRGLNDDITNYNCLNSNWTRGDVLVVRYADPEAIPQPPLGSFKSTQLYIRTAPFQASVVLGNPASSPQNFVSDTISTDYQVVAHAYFVADSTDATECGVSGAPALPVLAREELDTQPTRPGYPIKQELVTGVEQLQFQYGEDTGPVGNPLIIFRDADAVASWNRVRSVRFWVLVRDDCPDLDYTDNNSYSMGDLTGAKAYTPNDHFHRALYTSTVTLRN